MSITQILVPMLNANEPEATLVEVLVADGAFVKRGEVLLTIETTKAAADIEAERDGFFRAIAQPGSILQVGDLLGFLADDANETLPVVEMKPTKSEKLDQQSIRITEPARKLALAMGVPLASLPTDRLVTEAVVRHFAPAPPKAQKPIDLSKIVIYGAGGHAKAIMEMVMALGMHEIIGIVDDDVNLHGSLVLGIPVMGGGDILSGLLADGIGSAANGVGGIINLSVRKKVFEKILMAGFALPALCHPRATVEKSAKVADGVQVFANAYVGSDVILHRHCMVNTGAIVSHDCEIGELSHIAPGAMLAGAVKVGANVLLGMGITTAIGITVGDGCRIGNGAALLANVPPKTIVPAGKVWNGQG